MARNPITDFLVVKEAAVQAKRQNEIDQLNQWKKSGDPEHLQPLLKAYEPVMAQKMRQFRAPSLNESAFKAEMTKHLIGAFQSYDPSRGAQLATHVENRLRKVQRYNNRFQNMAYIPEGQARHIGRLQRAQDELSDELGRPPTHDEIGNHVGMPVKQVAKILSAQRKDIAASGFEDDPHERALQRDHEVLDLLPFNLTPDEKAVFNHLYGREGAAHLTGTNDIAKRLGKSPSQVSRLRTSILNKYQQYK